MQKLYGFFLLIISSIALIACQEGERMEEETFELSPCNYEYRLEKDAKVPVQSIKAPYSTVSGLLESIINPCDPYQFTAVFSESTLRTHQVFLTFDAIYPIAAMQIDVAALESFDIRIETSLDGVKYSSFSTMASTESSKNFESHYARNIKLIFPTQNEVTFRQLSFSLAEGYRVVLDEPFSQAFFREEGWTGADGIFSFDLNGSNTLNAPNPNTAFIFSDTFVGSVNPLSKQRIAPKMINNSLAYYDPEASESWTFVYTVDEKAIFLPDAYLNHLPFQLLSPEGLNISSHVEGRVNPLTSSTWLTDDLNASLEMTFKTPTDVKTLHLWNHPNPSAQILEVAVYLKQGETWTFLKNAEIQPFNQVGSLSASIEIDQTVTAIKLTVLRHEEGPDIGLSKLFVEGLEGPLFPDLTAPYVNRPLSRNDQSARLWLQDGIVIGSYLYVFPILVKNEANFFRVDNVGLMEIPIEDGQLTHENTRYLHTPLQVYTEDGGTIFFGAGVMDHRAIDGYIYVYGYKDYLGRQLIVARVQEADFLDFNAWTYFDGTGFGKDIRQVQGLMTGVSAELSVSYMGDAFEKPYLLVSMKTTTSGTVSYALADTPFGPFSDWIDIYQALEPQFLDAFTYNAKIHYHLSSKETIYISYNVNSIGIAAFIDANIYYPRFIRLDRIN